MRAEGIRVGVAAAQHAGAGDNAALHLGAEALAGRLAIPIEQVSGSGSRAAWDAVEAREVSPIEFIMHPTSTAISKKGLKPINTS